MQTVGSYMIFTINHNIFNQILNIFL